MKTILKNIVPHSNSVQKCNSFEIFQQIGSYSKVKSFNLLIKNLFKNDYKLLEKVIVIAATDLDVSKTNYGRKERR